MSFAFEQVKWDTTEKIASKEVAVQTSVGEMGLGGATKILDVIADGKLLSLDASGDTVRVNGRVNFKLLYLDGDGETRGLDYFADFSDSIQIEGLSGKLYGKIAVIDIDATLNGGIKLGAVVQIELYSVKVGEMNCLLGADEEFYTERKTETCQKFVTSFTASFGVTDDFDTGTDVMKVVMTDAQSYVDSVNVGMGSVLITGGVCAFVSYLADETLKTASFKIPFSEEIENAELAIGQTLVADTAMKSVRVVLTGIEGSNIIRLEGDIEVSVKAYETVDVEVVDDIFKVTHELNIARDRAEGSIFGGFRYFSDEVSGTATLSAESLPVLEVLSVLSRRNTVAQTLTDDGKIVIEGVFSATVLYRDESGLSSVELEVPYSLPFSYDSISKEDVVTAMGAVTKVAARLKRDREIEVDADLGFMTRLVQKCGLSWISAVEIGEEKDVNKSAVSVYIAEEGETIWHAAKALSARPDDIRAQNPEVESPYKDGDKIFYYRQINFEF